MARPLNILWMVTDHQLHARRAMTPRLAPLQTRLAEAGTRFTRAYSVLPVCSPARASMLTGLYPHAHGLTENDGRFGGRPGLDPSDWLLQRSFLEAGYRCAWFGKWHLDNRRSALDYGFEGFSLPGYGYPYGSAAYRDHLTRSGLVPPQAVIEMPGESGRPAGTEVALTEADDWLDHESGVARLEGPADTHEAFFLAALTEDWLQSVGDTPFFLRVDPWGPHPPYIVTSDFLDLVEPADVALPANFSFDLAGRPAHHRRYRDYWQQTLALPTEGWRRMTAAALAHAALVETALLKVLALLDRLGLAERTLVVFTADHGDAVGSNGGVANKGGLLVEETTHIPLVVRGPGIPAGRNCDHLATNLDLAPTLLTLSGLAGDAGCQGRRLFEADGRLPARGRPDLMLQHYGLHEPIAQRAYYRDGWKLVAQEDGFAELYDLRADPYELHNRADAPEDRDRLEALWAGLRSAMQDCGDTSPRLTKILDGPPG